MMNDIEKAIETLKDMKGVFGTRGHRQHSLSALDLAISALEKQIPKKTIRQLTDEKTHFKCICGSIQKTVYKDGYRVGAEREYCDRCGQAIDWEG